MMLHPGRIKSTKWIIILLGIILLSQTIARWKAFFGLPTFNLYLALIAFLSLFLLVIVGLGLVVYAEEKNRGTIQHPKPFFDYWAQRFFAFQPDEVLK